MEKLYDVLFSEDAEKVAESVLYHAMGSRQLGEVARFSSLLYDNGINVEKHLEKICHEYGILTK